MGEVETLSDISITTEGYLIRSASEKDKTRTGLVDLSKIDFEALQSKFADGRKRTAAEKLRGLITRKLKSMVKAK
jgi:type I restriction enzyme R subunit